MMKNNIFDMLSHTDFLRLTLEAFVRQGFEVKQSSNAGADGVLIGKKGARIGLLCKKYREALIGRPVLLQFYEAMEQIGCKEGYLITTTDCSPEAYEFAKGKGISVYSRERTAQLLRSAFGDEFMQSGRMPVLGSKAQAHPAAVRQTATVASYEKATVADLTHKRAQEVASVPAMSPEPKQVLAPARARAPEQKPDVLDAPGLHQTPEPELRPEPTVAPEPEVPAVRVDSPEPEQLHEPAVVQATMSAAEDLPEEVLEVENLDAPGAAEDATSENSTTIACAECNHHLRVPTDQGMITVKCTECGARWLYQPEMNSDGEVKTTTVIACQACSQKLNVPTNRGQLNVRCPKCGEKWLFTP